MNTSAIFELFLKNPKVTTDTRNIEKNSIFFALKGANFNGNSFANQAIEQGASAAIVDEKKYENQNKNIFYVDDALFALQDLARAYRNYLKIPFIGLTGSNGKTTTKELIAATLKEKFKVHFTYGNLNNHIGVPLTILSIPDDTEIAVIEMGANHQKEIELLCSIAQPNFGYITNFGKAHLEGFGGYEGVIKGKSELYDYLRNNHRTAFINLQDPIQVEKTEDIDIISFGTESGKYIIAPASSDSDYIAVAVDGVKIQTNLTGSYNFSNISCAIAIGKHFGLSIDEIKNGIEKYTPTNNRSQIIEKEGYKIIMDAYNANPSSMEASLKNFSTFKGTKTVILGDMFELGETSDLEHNNIARLALDYGFEYIYLLGKHFQNTDIQSNNIIKLENKEEFTNYVKSNFKYTDSILIKGSHGMRLDLLSDVL
ncbi:UDP-N-acetylmuramoyl-tripeptide--D-alanyl-D-alanine ligase [Faecalibacter rhinopitheci]|uniref:UDP-N-acetylmuramoyl-tripeptide--D-alanyl-D-alanine ligase n=1 Tax=Faecalibacter rhinopitheci TaxID=2779678 RepID=A0A8J7G332_9FLAO|nr:UDP-N-acetylmuramoyl-tripeptide--D-alanyl-D-alanine ligase [Faecalibacter rhinopitheci]MBF0595892.1 UDP-N-acetylmuramoyl-tripeptide--D-alanyl-D-alanine ligase [Faecalibacter rhinopitheci]